MRVKVLSTAKDEIKEFMDYYKDKKIGLEKEFFNEFLESVKAIEKFPEAHRKFSNRARMYLMKRFPFGIFYRVKNNTILILSVFHYKRKPKKW